MRRPTDSFLSDGSSPEALIGHTVYGESQPSPEVKNQRGKVVRLFDQAGVAISEDYDFKGNVVSSSRELAQEYKRIINWAVTQPPGEKFSRGTTYDALNRPIQSIAPHSNQAGTTINIIRPIYNEANLLEQVHAWLNQSGEPSELLDPSGADLHAVTNIDYNAKGQPKLIGYGNGASTLYEYDPETLRMTDLKTTRTSDNAILQGLHYTYDPVGNITRTRDNSQQAIYFNNQVVTPDNDYVYDAVYRLIEAMGREHIGQVSQPETNWNDEFRVNLHHPQNGHAMRRYTERYEYDSVGNFERLIHIATNGNWTRNYDYNELSLIEPAKTNNRLSKTKVGNNAPEIYPYDAHGNMTQMPHLSGMDWDFKDELQHVDRMGGGDTYYVYDASGQRVRKVVEKNGGAVIEERIYLGGIEIFRRRSGTGAVVLERETLHIMDNKQRIALVEMRTQGTDGSLEQLVRYQFSNHLGSAVLELDDAGQIISYEEYFPYGSTSYQAGRSAVEVNLKRYRYAGKERDEETGFTYHGLRHYVLWLGRWLSADPAGTADGSNLFVYSRNNPIALVDLNGMNSEEVARFKTELRAAAHESAAGLHQIEEVLPSLHDRELALEASANREYGRIRDLNPNDTKYSSKHRALNREWNRIKNDLERVRSDIESLKSKVSVSNERLAKLRLRGVKLGVDPFEILEIEGQGQEDYLSEAIERANNRASGGKKPGGGGEGGGGEGASGGGGEGGGEGKGVGEGGGSPKAAGIALSVVGFLATLPALRQIANQWSRGDRRGAIKTGVITAASFTPHGAIVLGAKRTIENYHEHREGINKRGAWLAEKFDPGTPFGVHTPVGGVVAGLYAVGESVVRTAGDILSSAIEGLGMIAEASKEAITHPGFATPLLVGGGLSSRVCYPGQHTRYCN